ncbi:MAG: hypothetical protein AAGH41_13425 [Pseudomonadota bacterium]
MREEFEELCLLMTDPTTLVGQAYANDPVMQNQCQSFLCKEGYDNTACDGFATNE